MDCAGRRHRSSGQKSSSSESRRRSSKTELPAIADSEDAAPLAAAEATPETEAEAPEAEAPEAEAPEAADLV